MRTRKPSDAVAESRSQPGPRIVVMASSGFDERTVPDVVKDSGDYQFVIRARRRSVMARL